MVATTQRKSRKSKTNLVGVISNDSIELARRKLNDETRAGVNTGPGSKALA